MADRKEIRTVQRALNAWLVRQEGALPEDAGRAAARVMLGLSAVAMNREPSSVIINSLAEDVAALERAVQQ